MPPSADRRAMPLVAALEVLRDARTDEIVITSMGSVREWPKLSQHPRDFHYMPSTMGGAAPLGVGLALARPDHRVIVLSGDGSLLMSLGSLATIAASGATNLTLVVIVNQVFEITGGQPTPGAVAGVDFSMIGQGCGIGMVWEFDDVEAWRANAGSVLAADGPRLVLLHVEPDLVNYHVAPPPNIRGRIEALQRNI